MGPAKQDSETRPSADWNDAGGRGPRSVGTRADPGESRVARGRGVADSAWERAGTCPRPCPRCSHGIDSHRSTAGTQDPGGRDHGPGLPARLTRGLRSWVLGREERDVAATVLGLHWCFSIAAMLKISASQQ